MRQASWIAFLLLALGLVSYEAVLDRQEPTQRLEEPSTLEGGAGMPTPKP
jgi:hypothetical protein